MKRILSASIAAAALTLAACETYPGDPYGAPPYPSDGPYGEPYPRPLPPEPYPPQSIPQPYPPMQEACPIVSSRDWRAWISDMPGTDQRPTLMLTGTVVAPTGGYRMEFESQLQERRSYPVQLVANLRPVPPAGGATQALTTHDLNWRWPLQRGPVGSVTILCGNRELAVVSPVETAR